MSDFSWSGAQHKGAMKIRREIRRREATERNLLAQPTWRCSEAHTHGNGMQCVREYRNGEWTGRYVGQRSELSRVVPAAAQLVDGTGWL